MNPFNGLIKLDVIKKIDPIIKKHKKIGEITDFKSRKIKYDKKEFYIVSFVSKRFTKNPYKYCLGFVVLDANNLQPIKDINLAKKIYNIYRIWESVYADPFFKPKYLKKINLIFELEKIINKKLEEYNYPHPKSKIEEELLSALNSLDRDLFDSMPILERHNKSINQIVPFFIKISDSPEDKIIEKLKEETQNYIEILEDLTRYIDVRKNNWLKMTEKLENYKIYLALIKKKSLKQKMIEAIGMDIASLIIPTNILSTVSKEFSKRFFEYVGGYEALEKAELKYKKLHEEAQDFLELYSSEIKAEVRF